MTNMLEEAGNVLDTLESNGYPAFFVGGYVRDQVTGRAGKDIDIATSATPDEVARLFPRTVPTGLQHGTVTVISAGHTFEVTTFRVETTYEQHRRPAEVTFVGDLLEDLQRRDFTMNAMALDRRGKLIDPFGGQEDIRSGLLRCVGDPERRFSEDALRMLRCVRFAAEYGLEVEADTWQALLSQRGKLRHIAMERVRVECERMLEGSDPCRALALLAASGLLAHLKQPLGLPLERWIAAPIPPVLAGIGALREPPERWALLLLAQRVSAAQARQALRRLTFARAAAAEIVALVECHDWLGARMREQAAAAEPPAAQAAAERAALARSWKRAAVRFGSGTLRRWLRIAALLAAPASPGAPPAPSPAPAAAPAGTALAMPPALVQELLRRGPAWLDELPAESVAQLAIDGRDLIRQTGQAAGPWLGRMLDRLLDDVAVGVVPNENHALLTQAMKYSTEWSKYDE